IKKDGSTQIIGKNHIRKRIEKAAAGYEALVSVEALVNETITNFYDGIKDFEVDISPIMAARSKVELEPAHTFVAANLLLDILYREAMGVDASNPRLKDLHKEYFKEYFKTAVSYKRLDPVLLSFDLNKLA